MKNKEIVSDIINDLRALSVDDRISERYVLSTLRVVNALFLKRENDQLRLYKQDIWTPIDCLKMIESDFAECHGIRKVHHYMRSEKKLPQLYSYSNGPLVKEAISLDDGNIYLPSTMKEFKSKMSREFPPKDKYFWIRDGYLIIPDGPEKVTFNGCFMDPSKARALSTSNKSLCINPMEEEFSSPPHLIDTVKDKAIERLIKVYKRVIKDEIADLDTNSKTNAQPRNNS